MRKLLSLGILSLLLGAFVPPAPAHAQDGSEIDPDTLNQYLAMVKQDLTARRDATLRTILELSGPEAQEFWPLQKAYDEELAKIGERHKELLREYSKVYTKLTPDVAEKLADGFFTMEEDRVSLQRKYLGLMSDKVSQVIAVQFLQLQNQFETMGDVKTSSYTPLAAQGRVDSQAQAAALDKYLEAVKEDLTVGRDAALGDIVQLSDTESKEFKKLKKSYDKELAKISQSRDKLLMDYRGVHNKLTADKAVDLANRFFTLDTDRIALHRKYLKLFSDQINPVVAVQFLQVQYRFETMANLRASTYVPLATR